MTRGFADAGQGAKFLLAHPRTWKWIAAPFVLALVLLGLAIWLILRWTDPLASAIQGFLPGWLDFVAGPVQWLAIIGLVMGGYFVYVPVAALLSAPFNECLSEEIEEIVTGTPGPRFSLLSFLRDLVLGLAHGARRLAGYLFTVVILLLISVFLPLIGPLIAGLIGAVMTARFAAYDAYDAIWARKGWSYRAKMSYLARHRGRTLGLGSALALLLVVPVCNLVALSIGAAGATLAYLRDTPASQ